MDERARMILREVQRAYRSNPGPDIDSGFLLQVKIMAAGAKDEFDEGTLIEMAREVGVPEDDIPSWMESFASWV